MARSPAAAARWSAALVTGLMTAAGGLGHTLPFLISSFHVAFTVAMSRRRRRAGHHQLHPPPLHGHALCSPPPCKSSSAASPSSPSASSSAARNLWERQSPDWRSALRLVFLPGRGSALYPSLTPRLLTFPGAFWGGLLAGAGWTLGPSLGSLASTIPNSLFNFLANPQEQDWPSLFIVWQTGMGFVLGLMLGGRQGAAREEEQR